MLKDKKILLAVCGSVSFYKSYEILSKLKKLGADVKVMLSDGVLKFTNPLSFEALTNHPVLHSGSEDWQNKVSHIEYAKTDLILIAPASANTINSVANGIANNVFLQTIIASKAPILIAPAANHNMLENFATQKSIDFLKQNGVKFIDPITKTLACGDVGKGALADIDIIIYEVKRALCKDIFKGKKVVITGGATTEKIDDVRAITNHSSGKMSKALADAFYYLGADTILISSIEYEKLAYKVHKFKSTNELLNLCKKECEDSHIIVMCAAISDYVCKDNFIGKLKKTQIGDEWSLPLTKNIDVLQNLKEFNCKKIGFKLETDPENAEKNAKDMLKNKNLDAVCLNLLTQANYFGSDQNEVKFIKKDEVINLSLQSKYDLSIQIAKLIADI